MFFVSVHFLIKQFLYITYKIVGLFKSLNQFVKFIKISHFAANKSYFVNNDNTYYLNI